MHVGGNAVAFLLLLERLSPLERAAFLLHDVFEMSFAQVGEVLRRDEAAVRIPNDNRLLAVLRKTGPLLVTSANAHSAETPDNVQDILAQLDGAPDLWIDGGLLRTTASTLVNCRVDPPVIERLGIVAESEVLRYLHE